MANIKVKDLVVDSGAFLRNCPLQNYGENIYTCSEVLGEVKSKWAKDQLQVLAYDIKLKDAEDEDLQFVIRFAKKTGDFFSLSDTDLRVIALAVRMEREKNGNIDHLNANPSSTQIVSNVSSKQNHQKGDNYGFNFINKNNKNRSQNVPQKVKAVSFADEIEEQDENKKSNKTSADQTNKDEKTEESDEQYYDASENEQDYREDNYNSCEDENSETEQCEDEDDGDFNEYYTDLIKTKGDHRLEDSISNQQAQSDDDDGDWITPSNIDLVKQQFSNLKINEKSVKQEISTACITGDFSMQNVLMQIGIKVLSVEKGLLIKQARQFVLRCIACFTITHNTTLMFCPSCGNLKTLKKVSVSVDQNGQKRIHLNPKRPITTRDVKLRIPRPRKGKYAMNPILVSDQHVPKFRQAKFAIQERKVVNESILSDVGYLVRDSPFSINDVYSRSSHYKTGSRAAAINKMVFNEGRKYANKRKKKSRN